MKFLSEKKGKVRRLELEAILFEELMESNQLIDLDTTNGTHGTIDGVALNRLSAG